MFKNNLFKQKLWKKRDKNLKKYRGLKTAFLFFPLISFYINLNFDI